VSNASNDYIYYVTQGSKPINCHFLDIEIEFQLGERGFRWWYIRFNADMVDKMQQFYMWTKKTSKVKIIQERFWSYLLSMLSN